MINRINAETEICPRCGNICNFTIINTFTKKEFCCNCMTEKEQLSLKYDIEKE